MTHTRIALCLIALVGLPCCGAATTDDDFVEEDTEFSDEPVGSATQAYVLGQWAGQTNPYGWVTNDEGTLEVCRLVMPTGEHATGKRHNGTCRVHWGGAQNVDGVFARSTGYGMLIDDGSYHWVQYNGGALPGNAVLGGHNNGAQMGICEVYNTNGYHPGKLYNGKCYYEYSDTDWTYTAAYFTGAFVKILVRN